MRDSLDRDFYFYDGYRSNNTNFKDLTSHRTGIPRNDGMWGFGALSRDDIIQYVHDISSDNDFIIINIIICFTNK